MGVELPKFPSRSQVGYLSDEIFNEGTKVIMSDGEQVSWNPPTAKPIMPDWSTIKSIRHYFGRVGYKTWPAWVYHKNGDRRLLKDQDEASVLGICYRLTTDDERMKYGRKAMWDWEDDCLWRPEPWPENLKFDPSNVGAGKTYMPKAPDPTIAQHDLIERLVLKLQSAGAFPAAPANVDKDMWDKFQQFVAWQKTADAVNALSEDDIKEAVKTEPEDDGSKEEDVDEESNALTEEQERRIWTSYASERGIKIDGRWSLGRLKEEVEKAS